MVASVGDAVMQSDTALPPPGSPAHGWMLRYTVFSCFTGSSAVVAGVILLASSCGIAHIFLVGLRVGLFPGLTPLPQETAEVLPTQLQPLLGGVRRKSILHENDLACVGYQRALKNPARRPGPSILIASKNSLASMLIW